MQESAIKLGSKMASYFRYVILQMAQVAVPQTLFREIPNGTDPRDLDEFELRIVEKNGKNLSLPAYKI